MSVVALSVVARTIVAWTIVAWTIGTRAVGSRTISTRAIGTIALGAFATVLVTTTAATAVGAEPIAFSAFGSFFAFAISVAIGRASSSRRSAGGRSFGTEALADELNFPVGQWLAIGTEHDLGNRRWCWLWSSTARGTLATCRPATRRRWTWRIGGRRSRFAWSGSSNGSGGGRGRSRSR